MRMPRTQFRFQSDLKSGFLNTFVQLKKMWVTSADSDPNNFDMPFGRKCSDSFDGQKKRPELDRI